MGTALVASCIVKPNLRVVNALFSKFTQPWNFRLSRLFLGGVYIESLILSPVSGDSLFSGFCYPAQISIGGNFR
jgi:hypothetical protein